MRLGERLKDVRLYGSWARGEPRVGSDIDVLILVRDLTGGIARLDDHGRPLIAYSRRSIGALTALENVEMVPAPGDRLAYRRATRRPEPVPEASSSV